MFKIQSNEDELLDELKIPEFKSSIPNYLAEGLTAKDRHVLDALSIIAQKQDFLFNVLVEERKLMRLIKRRSDNYEKIVLILTSKWSVVLYLIALLYPVLSTKLIQKIWP